jgi:hypothetical protein
VSKVSPASTAAELADIIIGLLADEPRRKALASNAAEHAAGQTFGLVAAALLSALELSGP